MLNIEEEPALVTYVHGANLKFQKKIIDDDG